jgi:hypothetical protein
MTAPPISTCIVCRNEADRLEACLKSIHWCDDIILMDLESSAASASCSARSGASVCWCPSRGAPGIRRKSHSYALPMPCSSMGGSFSAAPLDAVEGASKLGRRSSRPA